MILYNNLIPISLQVTLEMVRFIQVRIPEEFRFFSKKMFCERRVLTKLLWK